MNGWQKRLFFFLLQASEALQSVKIHLLYCLIIAGTSLTVYPAASFVRYFRGKYLVLINRDETPMDKNADLVIHDKVGEVLSKIKV